MGGLQIYLGGLGVKWSPSGRQVVAKWSLADLKNLTLLHNWLIFNLKSVFSPQRGSLWEFLFISMIFNKYFLKVRKKLIQATVWLPTGQWRLTPRVQHWATLHLRLQVTREAHEAPHMTRSKTWFSSICHRFQDEEPVEKENEWGFYPELRHRPSLLSSDSLSHLNPSALGDSRTSFVDSPHTPHLS